MLRRHLYVTSSILFMLILQLGGCTSASTTVLGTSDLINQENLDELNARASSERAVVTFTSGDQVYAQDARVAWDSTTWLDPKNGNVYNVRTKDIADVSFAKNTDQGGMSVIGGALAGALIGGIVGAAAGPFCWDTCTDLTMPFGGIGAFVGALVGVSIGAAKSNRTEVYQLGGMGDGPYPGNTRYIGTERE